MAYDKEKILKQAIEVAKTNGCVFIDEVITHLPCSYSTFYKWELQKSDELRDIIKKNAAARKAYLRNKWSNDDNATTQIALYRLLATKEEHESLNKQYIDHTSKGESIRPVINFVKE